MHVQVHEFPHSHHLLPDRAARKLIGNIIILYLSAVSSITAVIVPRKAHGRRKARRRRKRRPEEHSLRSGNIESRVPPALTP